MTQVDIEHVAQQVRTDGYAVVENVIDPDLCEEMAQALDRIESNHRVGAETTASYADQKVIYSPYLHEPELFLPWVGFSPFVDVANIFLGNDHVTLNGSSGSRCTGPAYGQTHIDGSMAVSDINHTTDFVTMIALDDFTEETGATHVWKGSHNTGLNPKTVENAVERSERVVLEAPRGSIIFFLGQTWHMQGGNTSGARRWAYIFQYSRWFIKPMYAHHTMGAEIYEKLDPVQKQLFGFGSRPPNRPGKRVHTVMDPAALPDDYDEALSI